MLNATSEICPFLTWGIGIDCFPTSAPLVTWAHLQVFQDLNRGGDFAIIHLFG